MSGQVIINDVGPRDGLQNQPQILEPSQRLRMIEALLDAGLPAVEVGSFVSPKAVPAMAGAAEVVAGLIAMLASEDGAHINGEEIRVDGGTLS